MLWWATLAAAVFTCGCVRADVMSRLIVPRDYGVKLCGREFIRAVIFTCGGSRWKRSLETDDDSRQWGSLLNVLSVDEDQQTWQRGSKLPDVLALRAPPSFSLADLLALQGVPGDWQPGDPELSNTSQEANFSRQRGGGDRAVPAKMKRNFSMGVAGMCCTQGCTKNDIGRLC